jgi:hypothetical protein
MKSNEKTAACDISMRSGKVIADSRKLTGQAKNRNNSGKARIDRAFHPASQRTNDGAVTHIAKMPSCVLSTLKPM